MNADTVAQTYVRHGDRWWFVSTANRHSSALQAYDSRYAETLVWTLDAKGKQDRIVHQTSAAEGSIREHLAIVERLSAAGEAQLSSDTDADSPPTVTV